MTFGPGAGDLWHDVACAIELPCVLETAPSSTALNTPFTAVLGNFCHVCHVVFRIVVRLDMTNGNSASDLQSRYGMGLALSASGKNSRNKELET